MRRCASVAFLFSKAQPSQRVRGAVALHRSGHHVCFWRVKGSSGSLPQPFTAARPLTQRFGASWLAREQRTASSWAYGRGPCCRATRTVPNASPDTSSCPQRLHAAGEADLPPDEHPRQCVELTRSRGHVCALHSPRSLALAVRTKPATLMHFRAVGSGTGRNELGAQSGAVSAANVQNHFAASDAVIGSTDNAPISPATGVQFLHFPTVIAAVGIFVNIPVGTNGYNINMTQCTLNDIFSGRCLTWDCAAIKALNPNLVVPALQPISIAIRSDKSGTSQVISSWLSGTTASCAASEGSSNGHIFGVGTTAYGANNNYFYNNAATAVAGAANVPSNVYPQAGTPGVVSFISQTPWSIGYIDNGQGIAAGLTEVAILAPSGKYVVSQYANLSASAAAITVPYPDGSTPTSGTPSTTAWPAVSLFDSSAANTFPIVSFSYIIVPSYWENYSNAYDAEAIGMLMALLQYFYYPETAAGYNYACGYTSNAFAWSATAYQCSSYQAPSILSNFYFAPLPAAWMATVGAALAAAASTGSLTFGGAGYTSYSLWSGTVLGNAAVPVWTFEPTEKALTYAASNPGGSAERVISYNRMSYADFQRTQNAELSATNAAAISNLTNLLVGTAGTTLGDRTVTYRLYGSGSSLQSKLLWRAMDLLQTRSKISVRMTYRSIGSGNGRNEFVGANNNFVPWGHFAASDSTMPSTGTPSYANLTNAGLKMLTIPTTLAAVGVFHTFPATLIPSGASLNMTAAVICGIYGGKITTWTDPAIKLLNPNVAWATVPANQAITVVTRQDSSGTTSVFSGWMAATSTCATAFTATPGSTVTWGFTTSAQPGSNGVTNFMSPVAYATTATYTNPYAIAYVDSGFALDSGLAEVAVELAPSTNVFATSTGLGTSGLSAPATGYPTSSFADWSLSTNWPSGKSPQAMLYNQYVSTGPKIYPILCFSYVFLRGDMTAMGESGRLATALIKFLFSADAGTPAGSNPENPASPLKFYQELVMSQPPQSIITQALTDIANIQFSSSAPTDWGFESFYASPGSSTNGYIQYQGFGDRVFSVWRSDYADYKVTSDSQLANAQLQRIYNNFVLINSNAATIATNVATLQALSTTVTTMQSTITSQAATIASLQTQITTLSNALGVTNGTVTVNTVGGSTTTTTSSTTTSVATAAIVVAAVGVLLSVLLGCYVIYLRPKNVAEGNKMAVSMAPLGRTPTPASV